MRFRKFNGRKHKSTYCMLYVVLGCVLLQSCFSYKKMPTNALLEADGKYKIVTKDGKKKKFRMATINDSTLTGTTGSGKNIRVHLNDIQIIKKRRFSLFKTAGLASLFIVSYEFIKNGAGINVNLDGLQFPN